MPRRDREGRDEVRDAYFDFPASYASVPFLALPGIVSAVGGDPFDPVARVAMALGYTSKRDREDPPSWVVGAVNEFLEVNGLAERVQFGYVTWATATYGGLGEMLFPEVAESSRYTTVRRAIATLEERGAIRRVLKGTQGHASVYVWLPLRWYDEEEGYWRAWMPGDCVRGDGEPMVFPGDWEPRESGTCV